jgi:hypothetical protein
LINPDFSAGIEKLHGLPPKISNSKFKVYPLAIGVENWCCAIGARKTRPYGRDRSSPHPIHAVVGDP